MSRTAGNRGGRSVPLEWDGHRLVFAPVREETVFVADHGVGHAGLVPGDWVSAHWDWLCERISARQVAALRQYTNRTLRAVESVVHPGPSSLLA